MNTNKKLVYAMVCALALQAVVPAQANIWSSVVNWWNHVPEQSKRTAGIFAASVTALLALTYSAYALYKKKKAVVMPKAPVENNGQEVVAQSPLLASAPEEEAPQVAMVREAQEAGRRILEDSRTQSAERESKEGHAAIESGKSQERSHDESKRSSRGSAARSAMMVSIEPSLTSLYKTNSTMFGDCQLDEATVMCSQRFKKIQEEFNAVVSEIQHAITNKNREHAQKKHAELCSLLKRDEHTEVYKQTEALLQEVEQAEAQNKKTKQLNARTWVLVPIRGEIGRMKCLCEKVLPQDIKNIR